MLRWTVTELSRRAQVAPNTVTRFEADKSVNTATVGAIQRAFEAAGAEFLPDDGVRLKAPLPPAPAGGGSPGGAGKPGTTAKSPAPRDRKPGRQAEPAQPQSKEAQIRALREQGAGQ
jgi:hypothetical protein